MTTASTFDRFCDFVARHCTVPLKEIGTLAGIPSTTWQAMIADRCIHDIYWPTLASVLDMNLDWLLHGQGEAVIIEPATPRSGDMALVRLTSGHTGIFRLDIDDGVTITLSRQGPEREVLRLPSDRILSMTTVRAEGQLATYSSDDGITISVSGLFAEPIVHAWRRLWEQVRQAKPLHVVVVASTCAGMSSLAMATLVQSALEAQSWGGDLLVVGCDDVCRRQIRQARLQDLLLPEDER